ncbi:hypothetical protein BZG36_05107 [Bifiguratus adelaidae]|uniref:Dolichyl-diphosphooligosaccharide--protein glycosyltransferase subunit WBP1 n=1 Tax=Bifiguratus adelaidae TaxID=1938954 RepID=A0A261XWJ4_9FUNG|nr:hypothetical protein BZG36_05107 [Bifiguratus adelaidae]
MVARRRSETAATAEPLTATLSNKRRAKQVANLDTLQGPAKRSRSSKKVIVESVIKEEKKDEKLDVGVSASASIDSPARSTDLDMDDRKPLKRLDPTSIPSESDINVDVDSDDHSVQTPEVSGMHSRRLSRKRKLASRQDDSSSSSKLTTPTSTDMTALFDPPSSSSAVTPQSTVVDMSFDESEDDDFVPSKKDQRKGKGVTKARTPKRRIRTQAHSFKGKQKVTESGTDAESDAVSSKNRASTSFRRAVSGSESEFNLTDLSKAESSSESAVSTDQGGESSDDQVGAAEATVRRRQGGAQRQRATQKTFSQRVKEKLLEHHPELETVWSDLDNMKGGEAHPIEQPKHLKLPLLPFQKEGVGWMCGQESIGELKGGILADEMGMGKTIQMISLLLSEPRLKPNLIIAPTVAIMQWKSEIETHTDNELSVYLFHGSNRLEDIEKLTSYDVVMTTYAVVEALFRRQEYGFRRKGGLVKSPSILHKIEWARIVLDEAHNIKDRSCNTARSVFHMTSLRKWSLTGTPLQNRVGELYSLIRFMQADPYGYYFCKKCPCKSLSWRFSDKKGCDECGHKPMDHVCWWNYEILKPIQNYGAQGEGLEAFQKLRKLLDKLMLRRTKVERADDLGLPPRTVTIRRDLFNEEEEDMYESLYTDSARKFSTYVEQNTVLNNYANIFELLMKMRQCVNHPDLVLRRIDIDKKNRQLVCAICSDPPEDAIISKCHHVFCRECCTQFVQSYADEVANSVPDCPTCFSKLSIDLSQPTYELPEEEGDLNSTNYARTSIINRINMSNWRSSTKIEALVEELTILRREDSTVKSIVFSQFVNFLDLVNWRLKRAGFECVKLDGRMSPQQRDATIKAFSNNPNITVFLISLKAGGVALNLTEASQVFICDPWWNPSTEIQAMDRIHRLGQHRPIKITRLIIENSIESRIVQLQEKKTALVESTIGKDSSALAKLSEEDLRFLFVFVKGNRVLVVLQDVSKKRQWSTFWDDLQERNYELDFKGASDAQLATGMLGEHFYDHIILFAPGVKSFASTEFSPQALVKFVKDGGNLLIGADSTLQDTIRDIAHEFSVQFDETDSSVIDHFNVNTATDDGTHTSIIATNYNPFISSVISPSLLAQPLLYKGIGHKILHKNPLVNRIVMGSSTAYSAEPNEENPVESDVFATGNQVGLVSATQARNSARVTFVGSLDLFSDLYFNASVTRDGKQVPVGNRQLAKELTQWTFQEKGVLKLVSTQHHKVGGKLQEGSYRIKDNVTYSVSLSEYKDDKWVPFVAPDVQLEIIMLDPYVRKTFDVVDTSGAFATYQTTLQLPDVYGVFTFKINYKRPGLTYIENSETMAFTPFRHNEFPRFLSAAWPYYTSAASMSVGFLVFSTIWLLSWGRKDNKSNLQRIEAKEQEQQRKETAKEKKEVVKEVKQQNFYTNLNVILAKELDDNSLYLGTSLRELVHKFKMKTLILLKLLLVEKKVLFYGYPASGKQTRCRLMLTLHLELLRHLQDSGAAELDTINDDIPIVKGSDLKSGDKASLLRYVGLPLHIFGQGNFFQPYLPLQQIDILSDRGTNAYMVGTTNQIFLHHKEEIGLDVLVNVENGTIDFRNPLISSVTALTMADRRWMEKIVKTVYDTWDPTDPTRPSTNQYLGSDEFLRAQFEEYLFSLLSSVKYMQDVQGIAGAADDEPEGLGIGSAEKDRNFLNDYGLSFVRAWQNTKNYLVWDVHTDHEIYEIVEPGHPGQGNISIEDIQNSLSNRIKDLNLDHNFGPFRERLTKAMSSSSNSLQKAVSSGSRGLTKAMDMLWSEFEKGMEQGSDEQETQREKGLVGRSRAEYEQYEEMGRQALPPEATAEDHADEAGPNVMDSLAATAENTTQQAGRLFASVSTFFKKKQREVAQAVRESLDQLEAEGEANHANSKRTTTSSSWSSLASAAGALSSNQPLSNPPPSNAHHTIPSSSPNPTASSTSILFTPPRPSESVEAIRSSPQVPVEHDLQDAMSTIAPPPVSPRAHSS